MQHVGLLPCLFVGLVLAQPAVARAGDGPGAPTCAGDCDGDGDVSVSELVQGVNILLGSAMLSRCSGLDSDADGAVRINELVQAVANALGGCACPLGAGAYTMTQVDGGTMRLGTLSPFPLPASGTLTLDLSAPTRPDCVHRVVVPFPDGLTMPAFCIPATGFSVSITQTGCGVGEIDSNGGSDFTVMERGDSSDSSPTCDLPNPGCPPGPPSVDTFDSSQRVDVTVGDGTPDGCSAGTANALLSVPVRTVIWLDNGAGAGYSCPAQDGTYDPEVDSLVLEFSHLLDFTTDAASAQWTDLDGDGCALAGSGPPGTTFSGTGVCLDLDARTTTLVAAGTVSSASNPLHDSTYIATVPNTFSGPDAPLNATCDPGPLIAVDGTVIRCVASGSPSE